MNISIIICTYNRAGMLRETLESFLAIQRPEDAIVEVLIVDNNSSDETPAIGARYCDLAPDMFRYVREPAQGLSRARNAGILSSTNDLIAFVDDDVYFDDRWLSEILNVFRLNPDAMCVGGRSIPEFETGVPRWMSDSLLTIYGSTNSGDKNKQMVFPEHPFGLNMAFRRQVFDTVGMFETALGRSKTSLLSNEETELFFRINRAEMGVFYTPSALIHHRILSARTQRTWVLRRYYSQGLSDVALLRIAHGFGRRVMVREAARALKKLTSLLGDAVGTCFKGNTDERTWFGLQVAGSYQFGIAMRALREVFRKPIPPDHQQSAKASQAANGGEIATPDPLE